MLISCAKATLEQFSTQFLRSSPVLPLASNSSHPNPYKKDLFETNFGPGFKGESFFTVFAVFFPAATGVLAGVNISGDLKNVRKAVPKGTLLAILISTPVYIMLAWFVGSCVEREAVGALQQALTNSTDQTLASCAMQECKYGLMNDFQVKC